MAPRMNNKIETLAVIMARGGSIGLPGKAMRELLGRPVIAYTLDHARESTRITRTVVSSDDPAVLDFANSENFETIARPPELATASSATDPVLRHAVRHLAKQNYVPGIVVMLYGNVPIRANNMIDRCIDMLLTTRCDSVQTVSHVGKMHPCWMFDRTPDARITKHIPNNIFRRQDLPPLYSPTGSVYAMRTEVLMAGENNPDPHAFLGQDRRGLIVETDHFVDIDSPKDMFLAEAMLRCNADVSLARS
jgi:N-acylneuraminate cytidylyltransferase